MNAEAAKKQATEQSQRIEPYDGSAVLIDALHKQGVEVIFGYPGGAVLPIYDALYKNPIRHILTRHEQGAIHAAEGYARVAGRPGVVIATSGPGATNLVTGITDAMMDSIPLVVFTGQVSTTVIGTDAFQEADIIGITQPITKHNYQVQTVDDLPRIVNEAFHIASTGRPGPVVVDIPKNVATEIFTGSDDAFHEEVNLPGYQPTVEPNHLQVEKAIELLKEAKKPLLLIGAGVLHSKATEELQTFVEKHQIPVTSTLLGLGAIAGNHPQFLGMAGMHGYYTANMAISDCDVLVNIGARFDDRLTGNLDVFASNAKVVHIDIDPAEIGKNVPTEVPIVGDAKRALEKMLKKDFKMQDFSAWTAQLEDMKTSYPLWYKEDPKYILPQQVLQMVHEVTKGDAVVTTDVGQHQMWSAQYYGLNHPDSWVTSGGLGTMGFGFPAAIGAQIAKPDRTVVSIVGDAGFQMTAQELSLLQEFRFPVKVIILNNGALGMVRQWQEEFYDERYSESLIQVQPDFVKLGEAYNIPSYRVDTLEEARQVFEETLTNNEPVLIDCRVKQMENVYPMVAPGAGLNEMIGVKRQ